MAPVFQQPASVVTVTSLASASMPAPSPDPKSAPPARDPLHEGPRSAKDVATQIQNNPKPEKIVALLDGLPEKLTSERNIENIREQLTKTLGEDRMLTILKQATPEQREKMAAVFLGMHAAADAAHLKETLASATGKGDAALREAQLEFVRDTRSKAKAGNKAGDERARDRVYGAAVYYNLLEKEAGVPDIDVKKLQSVVAAEERRVEGEKAAIKAAEDRARDEARALKREEAARKRAEHHK